MSQGPLCPNLTKKFQKEVSQMVNQNLEIAMLLGGLSLHLNHLKSANKPKQSRRDDSSDSPGSPPGVFKMNTTNSKGKKLRIKFTNVDSVRPKQTT